MSEPAPALAAASTGTISRAADGRFQHGNLYAFKRGISGNPKGRPRRLPLTEALERDFNRKIPATPEMRLLCDKLSLRHTATWGDVIARAMIVRAVTDTATATEIADRLEGRPTQRMEYAGANGGAIRISVHYEDSESKD